jgi:hypothetical protein
LKNYAVFAFMNKGITTDIIQVVSAALTCSPEINGSYQSMGAGGLA